ncbi:MAG: hypothetical protein Hals2KO_21670 [Halioglobus sp.]
MAVPTFPEYSVAVQIATNTAFRDKIDEGSGPGKLKLRDENDVLLSEIIFADPCGTVDVDGILTFTIPLIDPSAATTGEAAYGEFTDSDDNIHLRLPAVQSNEYVDGYVVMNTTSLIAGGPVTVVGVTVGYDNG